MKLDIFAAGLAALFCAVAARTGAQAVPYRTDCKKGG